MSQILETCYRIVWGVPALVLILGVGLYLSIRTGFAQLRLFPRACLEFARRILPKRGQGDDGSAFRALCTALAATVGTGNLAGVAGAIAIGGPGAIFWMWMCGILGMITKMAEAALAVRYRVKDGMEYVGGPMYLISRGLNRRWKWMAGVYAFFGVFAAFGVGNATQINAVLDGLNDCLLSFGIILTVKGRLLVAVLLGLLILILLLGGAKCIGAASEKVVPFAAAAYLILGTVVLFLRREHIISAFSAIVKGAFSPGAVTGGMVGSFAATLRVGVSRGVFTNEAGMGTAGIAHAGANVGHPVQQGLMGIIEVFLDTIVICTMTALVILCSGIQIPYGTDAGLSLTVSGFSAVVGDWVRVFLALSVCLFAFATVLGWGLYGARCAQYLFGRSIWKPFVVLQACVVVISAMLRTETIWLLAEIINGLMAVPNLIVLAFLSPELCRLIIDFQRKSGVSAGGGKKCRYPLTQTAVSPLQCGSSTPMRWLRKSRGRKYTT